MDDENSVINEVQIVLKNAITQIINNEVKKICFEQCFQNKKSYSSLSRFNKQCLSKCMDKMFSAYSIIEQATNEKVKELNNSNF